MAPGLDASATTVAFIENEVDSNVEDVDKGDPELIQEEDVGETEIFIETEEKPKLTTDELRAFINEAIIAHKQAKNNPKFKVAFSR